MAALACGKMDGNPKKHREITGNAERFEAKDRRTNQHTE
jgi:hypothetical protein